MRATVGNLAWRWALGWCAVLMVHAGCGLDYQMDVRRDDRADFARFRTYAWYPRGRVVSSADPRRDAEIRDRLALLIDRSLASEGLSEEAIQQADLWVAFQFTANRKTVVTAWGESEFLGKPTQYPLETIEARQGMLVVDLFDRRLDRVIWRGVVTGTTEHPDLAERRMPGLVRTLISRYKAP